MASVGRGGRSIHWLCSVGHTRSPSSNWLRSVVTARETIDFVSSTKNARLAPVGTNVVGLYVSESSLRPNSRLRELSTTALPTRLTGRHADREALPSPAGRRCRAAADEGLDRVPARGRSGLQNPHPAFGHLLPPGEGKIPRRSVSLAGLSSISRGIAIGYQIVKERPISSLFRASPSRNSGTIRAANPSDPSPYYADL